MKNEKPDRPSAGPRYVVIDDAAGQRLDNYLIRSLKGVPRTRIYRMVRRGEVRVNGGRRKADYRLVVGDELRIPPYRGGTPQAVVGAEALGRRLEENVLFEDERMLVLDKPSGVAVHGGSGVSAGAIEALRAVRPGSLELAHRIDRDTSGCLIVAKQRAVLLEIHAAFREADVHKRYDVIVAGPWPRRIRTVNDRLRRYTLANGERRVRVSADGERARTDFEIQAVDAGAARTWLAAFPRTGRTHQIRVHAAHAGCPILGDDKYAQGQQRSGRLMLHATRIRFRLNGELRRFEAPMPASFEKAGAWRR